VILIATGSVYLFETLSRGDGRGSSEYKIKA